MSANPLSSLSGVPFTKMTGSGNDFVFFDGRVVDRESVTRPEVISAICNRHNGIGGDGVVVLEPAGPDADARIIYFNSDGSPADLCGNATLCSATLSVFIKLANQAGITLATPAGLITARVVDGQPEFDLGNAQHKSLDGEIELEKGERRIGFAVAGIPHLVVLCDDAGAIDVEARGPALRWHSATGPEGANVNWISEGQDGVWNYRTFERGVEGETLACGTGAIAIAVMLVEWGLAKSPVRLRTRSSRVLEVRLLKGPERSWRPTLRGEGRIVFAGTIGAQESV